MSGKNIRRFTREDSGNALIEYIALSTVASVSFVSLFVTLGGSLSNLMTAVQASTLGGRR